MTDLFLFRRGFAAASVMRLSLLCLPFTMPVISLALPNLPVPLALPAEMRETFRINPDVSYFGDAVRIVDCPKQSDNPLGTCDNWLFGGLAMWDTHISGVVEIQFFPAVNNIAHFQISHLSDLVGDDTVIAAPQQYEMRVRDNRILDALDNVSSGDLNLLTGEVRNVKYTALFSNTWYGDLTTVNPKLKPPDFTFPGIYGNAQLTFEQRPDGKLDLTLEASTFLPLNNNVLGEPVRIPMPFCGPLAVCSGIQAPGTSLHPHIYWTTKTNPAMPPSCAPDCADLPANTIQSFTGNTYYTSFGDHFTINIPQLGGLAKGRTHLQGRVQLQFGPVSGHNIPIALSTLPPLGFLAAVPVPPAPLSAFKITMFGHDEFLHFPLLTYVTASPVLLEDAFDLSVGSIDLNHGNTLAPLLYRGVPAQSLFSAIIGLNITRIPLDTFRFRGPAYVSKGPNGESVFGLDGSYLTSFESFSFPSPNYDKPNEAHTAGPGSDLNPFLRFQGVQIHDQPRVTKSVSSDRLVSSFNEVFQYSYSISCDPSVGTGSLDYTNYSIANGGTFHLENLSSVSCFNSKTSTAGPGDYDTVTIVGYGVWSGDVSNGRHLISFQESRQPNLPLYVTIQVDGGLISKVHLKPVEDTIP